MEHAITNIIFPTIASILTGIFLWKYLNKPRLNFYFSTGYTIAFPAKESSPGTIEYKQLIISLTILNGGKITLKNVQIFHILDISYNKDNRTGNSRIVALGISPNVPHEFSEDGQILIFKSLAPKESITINYSYPLSDNPSVTNIIHQCYPSGMPMIRSDETLGEMMNFVKQTVNFPRWVKGLARIILIVGFWVSASFLANLISLVNIYNKFIC